MNCRRCGARLNPGQPQITSAVDHTSGTTTEDSRQTGGVCPFCGSSDLDARFRRKRVLFGLFKALLLVATAVEIVFYISRTTERSSAAKEALARMSANEMVVQFLGNPSKLRPASMGTLRKTFATGISFFGKPIWSSTMFSTFHSTVLIAPMIGYIPIRYTRLAGTVITPSTSHPWEQEIPIPIF